MKGRLLVLEGIDGCGKTTQINHLTNWLPVSGLMPSGSNLLVTREPGGTHLGNSLRELLLNTDKENAPAPLTELLLYAADRAQHISQKVLPAITQGDWVLSDRFTGSTLAYQGYGRNLDLKIIKQLQSIATQKVSPDLTILLDIGIQESMKRRQKFASDRIEGEGKDFLTQVSFGFTELAKDENWICVNAENPAKDVSLDLERAIKNFFKS